MPHGESEEHRSRILFLDAYDSFSNNIIALLHSKIDVDIHILKIDDPRYIKSSPPEFRRFLQTFDAVVAGPGPGNPTIPSDVGLINRLWSAPDDATAVVPVLGICLGFQSLAYAYGARIERLPEPRHGIVQEITHNGTSIFEGTNELLVTQYHSLRACLDHDVEHRDTYSAAADDLSTPSKHCSDLLPLAWTLGDGVNGSSLMAVRHLRYPFWGVQFHPESICTNEGGKDILRTWWREIRQWRYTNTSSNRTDKAMTALRSTIPPPPQSLLTPRPKKFHRNSRHSSNSRQVKWSETGLRDLSTHAVCQALRSPNHEIMLLESGTTSNGRLVNAETGRFSIIGCIRKCETEQFQYFCDGKRLVAHISDPSGNLKREEMQGVDIFRYLRTFTRDRRAVNGPVESPFWGGLIGYISYEAGLETIDISGNISDGRPDAWFIFVERSIVIDHIAQRVFVQDGGSSGDSWIAETSRLLESLHHKTCLMTALSSASCRFEEVQISGPSRLSYCAEVRRCQAEISAGNSYELCLTSQTHITTSKGTRDQDAWQLYTRLQKLNPAPFSAYLCLRATSDSTITNFCDEPSSKPSKMQGVTILSSSPERFLSFNRPSPNTAQTCQFRPIKGTVSKSVPGITRARAEAILQSSKERAENLMIVDLVRHDLHGVVGARNVNVKKLMGVEEYEKVWQLVSVVEGTIPVTSGKGSLAADSAGVDGRDVDENEGDDDATEARITGLDILQASLPPGSMTGAPKRRSCALLQEIEDQTPRGIYSGVLGYLEVGGGGDFSVVIRTAVRWDDRADDTCRKAASSEEEDDNEKEMWTIGAGGAVTSQSTDVAEWEEMCVKREALLKLFEA